MRHHNKTKKFGRQRDQRKAFMRSLASALILEERIQTTEARAKALRPFVEKLITRGRKEDLSTRRLLTSKLGSKEAVRKIIENLAPKYKDRPGGYTRIIKTGIRRDDASPQAIIEFI